MAIRKGFGVLSIQSQAAPSRVWIEKATGRLNEDRKRGLLVSPCGCGHDRDMKAIPLHTEFIRFDAESNRWT